MSLKNTKNFSIYLGNKCNFNCTYCDREYIKNEKGSQSFSASDIDALLQFIDTFSENGEYPIDLLDFHGGETFVFVKTMDKILTAISNKYSDYNFPVFIQTNGSLLLQHEWFIEKWKHKLYISISYDFMFQTENRTAYDIDATLTMLKTHIGPQNIQMQFVIPINNAKAFSLDCAKSIADVMIKNGIKKINLIPLRHIRGGYKFRTILDEVDLNSVFNAFLRFIQILYAMNIYVIIDGHSKGHGKNYFDNYKQLIISPDGFVYPEYDFLEYRLQKTIIGRWKKDKVIPIYVKKSDDAQEKSLIYESCATCEKVRSCGLKYLFHEFNILPSGKCVDFYKLLDMTIIFTQQLNTKPTVMHHIMENLHGNDK